MVKSIGFIGDSLKRLKDFPQSARREMGFQLDKVQRGLMPDNWKPMNSVGKGVNEIRVRDSTGAYRVMYVATFPEAVYVLHAFQKKRQTTAKADLELARARLQSLIRSRK
ncbi:MAG: type II toxin-antitoxin system RelE/ParE family toxin [Gammaproteobacteria bacterium]|nr:MAG: type II toxin-antitoxin system RelE/ParE family toxin [Gammaproteobacteria bacterium]